ncbi:hypothetical protein [Kineobactrum salinum]|uniref:Uncharacterized protein n=1 Tax=Kineobactrum salinum TaxID=2708301 RepID=A0A6C0U5G5_9GAMM|nr:hypothetical protein [Kineobactrum salinum]QIB67168.1 hypothetical protein G3T16_18930 [Kineobactrum salinum]
MALAQYTELFPDIQPVVMACPRPAIVRALQAAGQAFFQESQAYIHTIDELMYGEDYEVLVHDLPEYTRLVAPLEVTAGGQNPLKTTNPRLLAIEYRDWRAERAALPSYVMLADNSMDTLIVAPALRAGSQAVSILGRAAIKPTRRAPGVEESVLDEFSDGLVFGALSNLLGQPGKEWSDARKAATYTQMFYEEIGKAKNLARRGTRPG